MEGHLVFDPLFHAFSFTPYAISLGSTRLWWHDSKLWKARPSWWQPGFFFVGRGPGVLREWSGVPETLLKAPIVWFSSAYSRLRKKWESHQASSGFEVQQNFSTMEMTLLNPVLPWEFASPALGLSSQENTSEGECELVWMFAGMQIPSEFRLGLCGWG